MNMNLKKRLAAVAAVTLAGATNVMAAVPAEVTTAISDSKSDAITVATAVLVVIVAIFAFKLLRKAL